MPPTYLFGINLPKCKNIDKSCCSKVPETENESSENAEYALSWQSPESIVAPHYGFYNPENISF